MEIRLSIGGMSFPATDRTGKGKSLIALPSDYFMVDLETTGFSPEWNDIIEIGAIHYRDGQEVDRFQSLVQPPADEDGLYVDSYIEHLTGISNEMLSTAPSAQNVLPRFMDYVKDSTVLGYNVAFDVNFLYDNCLRYLDVPFRNDYVDVMRLARKICPGLPHHRLKDMADHYAIAGWHAHRTISDCEVTEQVYQKLRVDGLAKFGTEQALIASFHSHGLKYAGIRPSDIIADESKHNPDCPIYQRHCVITGKLDRYIRAQAMQLIADLGGINDNSVTKNTNYLILGNNDYCTSIKDGKSSKQKKAEALQLNGQDIEIIPENVFYDMIADYLIDTETNPAEPASENQDIKDEQVQMTLTPSTSECPIFGGYSYDAVYDAVLQMVGGDKENVVLKVNKASVAIYMFDTNAFTIILNSRTKCLKTTSKVAYDYADAIGCATVTGSGMTIPLDCGTEYLDAVSEMVRAVYKSKQSSISSNMIGCCDMFRMCSDALRCLRSDDPHYNGCYYRKNLEAGRIFYGRNKNI